MKTRRTAHGPQGFPVEKVLETRIRGLLPTDDLDVVRGILTLEQDDLTKDEMVEVISAVRGITEEAASILVSSWFDGGRYKKDWGDKEINFWIRDTLSTKIGKDTDMRTRESRIAANIVATATFRDFENALKNHDWTYSYSDDHGSWSSGEASMKRINEMAKELVDVDPKKVEALFDKYGKMGWGSDWKPGAGQKWVQKVIEDSLNDSKRKRYVQDLMVVLRKVGNHLGKTVDEGSYEMNSLWTYYVVVVSNDGHKFELSAYEWNGGSGVGTKHNPVMYKGKWLRPGGVDLKDVEWAAEMKGMEMLEVMRKKG